ncbi:MAG: hypothetical protein ABL895_07175 [Cyclobacteriaceae bacterium]
MKVLVSVFLFVTVFSTVSFAKVPHSSLKVLSVKRSVLYFKNSKDMIGATIDIENEEHDLIEATVVEETRTIVDFFFLAPGTYTVRIKKNEKEYLIEYVNK